MVTALDPAWLRAALAKLGTHKNPRAVILTGDLAFYRYLHVAGARPRRRLRAL
jgi:hypothetical protein